ncbi:MAG: phosphopantetheine-binding protein, partial [Gammaproteobacteria bacterium]
RDLLGEEELGVHDDFFALGGHSLMATRLVARIRDRLGVDVALEDFFAMPTIASVAAVVEQRRADRDTADAGKITTIPRLPRRAR